VSASPAFSINSTLPFVINIVFVSVFEDVQQDCTIFSGVFYLGSANINAPKSEREIQKNMEILNEQLSEDALKVSVSIPSSSEGIVL